MSEEKARRYVIYGAGAIGGGLAGLLARRGERVICVARPAQAEALWQGVSFARGGEEFIQPIEAVTGAPVAARKPRGRLSEWPYC